MIIDPRKYSESVTKNLNMESSMNLDVMMETATAAASKKEGIVLSKGEDTFIKNGTYQKPRTEDSVMEHLEENAAISEKNHKDQMVIMSQTTSVEDCERLQEEGYSIHSTDSHTVVTVTDKIKAVLMKSGDFSMGELSKAQLEEITGSVAMAQQITNLQEDAKAYLLRNHMDPTIEQVYKATHAGQFMKSSMLSEADFEKLQGQIEKLLEEFQIPVDNSSMNQCQWLISHEIPVTQENITYLKNLNQLEQKLLEGFSTEELTNLVKKQVQNGGNPADTMLIKGYSIEDRAQELCDLVAMIEDEDIVYCIENDQKLTLQNLELAHNKKDKIITGTDVEQGKLLTARRQLEEIRLLMTIEANKSLLKKGIQIDTQEIELALEHYKKEEDSYYRNLLSGEGIEPTEEAVGIMRDTQSVLSGLKMGSFGVISMVTREHTLKDLEEQTRLYAQKAISDYETLMTKPRTDMGDSIRKAFQNVDDILTDLGMETSEANQRAVRILAYNEMELSVDNIHRIKAEDELMQQTFKNLTPKVTLEMVRQGINPLELSIEELNQAALEIKASQGMEDVERFGEYLFLLERNHKISEAEKESCIGIYRLIAQVEKADGAAVGALITQGAELSMKNLLMAIRSDKKTNMDYVIDDHFSGVENHVKNKRIDDQIMAAYYQQCAGDALDLITPQKALEIGEESVYEMNPEQLKEQLQQLSDYEEELLLHKEYIKEQLSQVGQALEAPEQIYDYLHKFDIPTSVDNVLATMLSLRDSNSFFQKLYKSSESNREKVEWLKNEVLEQFGEATKVPYELAKAQEALAEVAENAMKSMVIESPDVSTIDLRQMQLISAGLHLMTKQTKEEAYLVPVETAGGICAVAVKIQRDENRKGIVDIAFKDELAGKIAARFEAKEDRLSGVIAVSDELTRNQLSENLQQIAEFLNEGLSEEERESIDLQVAYISDLSLEKYQMNSLMMSSTGSRENEIQTKRLYHIAEGFLRAVQEFMGEGIL